MNTLREKFAWGDWGVGETMHYIDYKCKEENDLQPGLFANSLGSSNYDQGKLPSKTILMALLENLKCCKIMQVLCYHVKNIYLYPESVHFICFSYFTHLETKMI